MTADDVTAVPRDRLEALVVAQAQQLATSIERIAALEGEKAELELKLQQALRTLYGPSSEKTKPADQPDADSLLGLPVHTETEAPAAPETETITYQRKKGSRAPGSKGHGRNPISRELRPVEIIIPATPEQRIGPNGETLVLTGYEISEKLDLIPMELIRLIIKRERYGFADTRQSLFTAAVPSCLTPKGKATDAFIHESLIRKFFLGLPLYRQAMDFNSYGAQINDSWLVDCVRAAAQHYRPIARAIRNQVLSNRFLQADETPIRQQTDTGIHTSYFWVWLGGGQTYFHFGTSRGQDEVAAVLGITDEATPWERGALIGYLVCDGYAGYNPVFTPKKVLRVACWAHVRRKFYDIRKSDRNAANLVLEIDKLFRIERHATAEINDQQLDEAAASALRVQRRQTLARPIIDDLKKTIERLTPLYAEGGRMREALNYASNFWDSLIVYIDIGELPLDNNAAERAIRPIAVGRKAYLFVGSEDGGEWAAIFYSIIESCKMQKIDPRKYLAHVTPLLIGESPPPADTLTPLALRDVLAKR
jgi:transposase